MPRAVTQMRPLPAVLALAIVSLAILPLASAAPSAPACDGASCMSPEGADGGALMCGGYVCSLINDICKSIDGRSCVD
ncbi:MAG: hypothetical protein QOI63_433 [Thermoplasmata archaeon]|jgi:hypothetical protein|nr:hypothetical protein [Thermoplasmata archaeon]